MTATIQISIDRLIHAKREDPDFKEWKRKRSNAKLGMRSTIWRHTEDNAFRTYRNPVFQIRKKLRLIGKKDGVRPVDKTDSKDNKLYA